MATLILRVLPGTLGTHTTKGSPLTHAEMDQNWLNLDAEMHVNEASIQALQLDVAQLQVLATTAGPTAPTTFAAGTAWLDTTTDTYKVYNGTQWIDAGATLPAQTTAPTNPSAGDGWFDTNTNTIKVYDGTTWVAAGGTNVVYGTTIPAATGNEVTGDTLFITTDGTSGTAVLAQYVWDGAQWKKAAGGSVSYGTTAPAATGNAGDEFYITTNGLSSGTVIAGYVYDGTQWTLTGTIASVTHMAAAPTVSGTEVQGDIAVVTSDGTSTGTVLAEYIFDGSVWVKTSVGGATVNISTAAPMLNGTEKEGDEWYVTDDGTATGAVTNQYIFEGTQWVEIPLGLGTTDSQVAAADPGTRSDGTALQNGDTYYNTTTKELMVYDSATVPTWQSVNVDVIDDLDDVDTTTNAPTLSQALVWNGTNWIPGDVATGTTDSQVAAADPGTRSDGTALQAGDTYYNTTTKEVMVYDGATWSNVGGDVDLQTGTVTPTTRSDGTTLEAGDQYYDTATNIQYVYDGTSFVRASAASDGYIDPQAADPATREDGSALADGDIYYNTTDKVYYQYDLANTTWITLGGGGGNIIGSFPTGSEPTTRGDGSALQDGDLFYNTTTKEVMVYDSATVPTWQSVNADVIDDLDDVDTTTNAPADGNVLVWDAANSVWVPGSSDATAIVVYADETAANTAFAPGPALGDTFYDQSTGELKVYNGTAWESANVDVIDDLDDVDTTSTPPVAGDVLVWDSVNSVWVPGSATASAVPSGPTGSEPTPAAVGDVYYDTTTGELMVHNGTTWESANVDVIDDLDDVDTTTNAPTDGQSLIWDNANSVWVPGSANASSIVVYADETAANTAFAPGPVAGDTFYDQSTGELKVYNGTAWESVNADVIGDLDDVDTTTNAPTDGQVLVWDNTNSVWVPADSTAKGVRSDTTANTPGGVVDGELYYDTTTKQLRVYDATDGAWKDVDVTVASVSFDATTTHDTTDATTRAQNGNLTITLNDAAATQFVVDMDGRYVQSVNGVFIDGNGNVPVSLTSVEVGDTTALAAKDPAQGGTAPTTDGVVHVVTGDADPTQDGKTYIWSAGAGAWYQVVGYDQAAMDVRYVQHTEGLNALTDTTITAATTNDLLQFNGTSWVNVTPANLVLGSIDQHSDVDTTTTAPTAGQALVWNGTNWIPGDVAIGTSDTQTAAADPGTRSDGTALQDGDIYYNTTDNTLYVYEGGVWNTTNPDLNDGFLGAFAAAPTTKEDGTTNVSAGDVYYNTGDNTLYAYDGTTWNAVGTPPSVTYATAAPTAAATMGDEVIVTSDGTSTGTLVGSYVYDGSAWYLTTPAGAVAHTVSLATAAPTAAGVVVGDEVTVTSDGTATGAFVSAHVWDGSNWLETSARAESVTYNTQDPTTAGATGMVAGDEWIVSSDGTATGTLSAQYIYDGTNWTLRPTGSGPEVVTVTTTVTLPAATGTEVAGDTLIVEDANGLPMNLYIWDGSAWQEQLQRIDGSPDGGATDDF